VEDICNFIPPKTNSGNIEYRHFVYESNYKKLKQPFFLTTHRIFLVFKGEGVFKTGGRKYKLKPGTVFFTFPKAAFELEGTGIFTYLYISFEGDGVKSLLDGFKISDGNCVFDGFEQLKDFWMTSIRRVNPTNATTLTESVLLYSLSFIGSADTSAQQKNKFDSILSYIDDNFTDPTLSVKKLADIYFYSEKYLSSLFVKKKGVKLTEYLNKKRISYAEKLILEESDSVSRVALKCGFTDPLYFSKVFKKYTGVSPCEYRHNSSAVMP